MANVLMLDQYAGLGGGQRILSDLAGAFRQAGHAVRVMVPGEGTTSRLLRDEGFPVSHLPLPEMTAGRKPLVEKLSYLVHAKRAAKAIGLALGEEKVDLIYANAPRCVLPAVWAARRAGVDVACGLHLIFRGGLEHRLLSWCFRQPEIRRVIFCSDAVAEPFLRAVGPKGAKVLYWVSPPVLQAPPGRPEARGRYGLSGDDVAVGVIGRISKTKGQRMFLEALMPLLPAHPRLKLVVAGVSDFEDPAEEDAVKALAARAPLYVTVTGAMVDSREFLDAMDVLVVPSLWEEPFGLVAVEGMARSLPVVVTRSGGLQEIVEQGITGFVVEKEASALRAAVGSLVTDSLLRARMGQAGRERVMRMFHPATQMGRIIAEVLRDEI
jgi:glycosyltransferase involved in cell wall biosynthesis